MVAGAMDTDSGGGSVEVEETIAGCFSSRELDGGDKIGAGAAALDRSIAGPTPPTPGSVLFDEAASDIQSTEHVRECKECISFRPRTQTEDRQTKQKHGIFSANKKIRKTRERGKGTERGSVGTSRKRHYECVFVRVFAVRDFRFFLFWKKQMNEC